jgi:short-subunit dehydrogenase
MSKHIAWITGGSSGIGAETALLLAQHGWTVAVTATTPGKIDVLCDKDPKFLKAYPGDVTKPKKMEELVEQIEKDLGPIELAIFNAGTYEGDHFEDFTATRFKKHFEVNVLGVANCLEPIKNKFLDRKSGHIAIMASIAGYRGLPFSISYGATKAALNNMAEALAIETYGTNIKVQVINPGFVRTPLTDQNDFYMPMRMEPEKAAEKLVAGLKSRRFEIMFPWPFCMLTKIIGWLPDMLYIPMMAQAKKQKKAKSKTEPSRREDRNKDNNDQKAA